jgi:dTDP-4-dehydrorhamnose 3,5-epimerase
MPAAIPEVLDARGYLLETFNRRRVRELTGLDVQFVQENLSGSARNVLRGLHYRLGEPQGKLVTAVRGEIFDVAVDVRRGSASFGQWTGCVLSASNRRQAWIPPGFAHGFLVLSESADVLYKLTAPWSAAAERAIAWNDPQIRVQWPLAGDPLLSERDARAPRLQDAELP